MHHHGSCLAQGTAQVDVTRFRDPSRDVALIAVDQEHFRPMFDKGPRRLSPILPPAPVITATLS